MKCKLVYQLMRRNSILYVPIFLKYFSGNSYQLLHHNCNNFSEEIAQFLCGVGIPKYILDLPNEVLNTQLGPAIPALVAQLEKSARPIAEERRELSREASPDLSKEIEEARSESQVNGVDKGEPKN